LDSSRRNTHASSRARVYLLLRHQSNSPFTSALNASSRRPSLYTRAVHVRTHTHTWRGRETSKYTHHTVAHTARGQRRDRKQQPSYKNGFSLSTSLSSAWCMKLSNPEADNHKHATRTRHGIEEERAADAHAREGAGSRRLPGRAAPARSTRPAVFSPRPNELEGPTRAGVLRSAPGGTAAARAPHGGKRHNTGGSAWKNHSVSFMNYQKHRKLLLIPAAYKESSKAQARATPNDAHLSPDRVASHALVGVDHHPGVAAYSMRAPPRRCMPPRRCV
jgi:hypothetical protein